VCVKEREKERERSVKKCIGHLEAFKLLFLGVEGEREKE
jgi:hypothetical protein